MGCISPKMGCRLGRSNSWAYQRAVSIEKAPA
jgi:hypothetical protein